MTRLGAAIVGTGWVSHEYVKAFAADPRTELRALVSADAARARARAAEWGLQGIDCHGSLEPVLADPGVHIVVLCSRHATHAAQGAAAAQAGKHIVVEKPVALDLPSLRELDRAVRSSGVRSVVSFVLRWNPLFETIKSMLADGLIGEVYYGEVDYLHGIGPWYGLWSWHRTRREGGSALLTAGCHAVDGLRWFLGARAVEVSAYANTSKGNALQYEYDPNIVTLVKFDNGAVGKVATSVECALPYMFDIRLLGEQGTIHNNRVFTRRWPGQKGWASIPTILPDSGDVTHHPFAGEIRHFVDCIVDGKESHCNVADAVETHEICLAADVSAREGRPVRLPLAAG
jgi:predicted dehydrogenase